MKQLLLGLLLLLVAAGNAFAGQGVATYYVGDRWTGTNEASLPHYQTPGEGCIGVLQEHLKSDQTQHVGSAYRYRLFQVGQYDQFGYGCGGEVDTYSFGRWLPVETFDVNNDYVYPFSNPVTCTPGGADSVNGQCLPAKCTACSCGADCTPGDNQNPDSPAIVGNPIDAGSGNKHQVETDYVGAGAFPLHFERIYDSSRTWLNNPIPVGVAWTHNYQASITLSPAEQSSSITQAVAYRPDGSIHRFNLNGSVWTADADIAEQLSVAFDADGVPSATLTTTDDTVERYDGIGRLASITNRAGLTQTLSYTSGSNNYNALQTVTDPQGHTLTLGYNPAGQLTTLTDGNGAKVQYGYDSNGNLTSAIYPDAGGGTKTRQYSYNETGQVAGSWPYSLTGISDETATVGVFQRYASWGYDSTGRAVLSVHGPYSTGTIDKTTLSFNDTTGATSFTDALGQTRTYGFNVLYTVAHPSSLDVACDGCSAHDKARGYDGNGYPNARTDFNGNQATYAFAALDANGHPRGLETQRFEGIPPSGSTDTSAKRTINTQWSASFRVPIQQDVIDNTAMTAQTVQTTKWIYNIRGQPTFRCLIDPKVNGASTYICGSKTQASIPAGVRQWAWTYCESVGGCPLVGLLLTAKGPRTDITNDLTTYVYFPSTDLSGCATGGACHYLGDLQTVSTPANGSTTLTTTYVSYDGNGRPTRILDPNGVPTDLSYHPRGWLAQRAVRNAATGTSTSDRITAMTYDVVGHALQVTQPAGDYFIFGYDNAHRLTDTTNRLGEKLHYVLDDAGNRKEEDSSISSGTIYHKVLRDYNLLGRLQDVKNAYVTPASLAMSYQYDGNGNVQQTTDGLTRTTVSTYDPRNRLEKTEQDSTGLKVFTNYAHDALDRLTDVIDPQGLPTHYTVDGLNNLTQLTSPDTGTTTYGYDAAGNRTSQTDARKVASIYAYDALNRLTGATYPATPSLNIGYTWDTRASSCPTADSFTKGMLGQIADSSGSTQFCYDRFAETVAKTQTIAGSVFALNYTYNKDKLLTALGEPNGTLVTYGLDNNERITSVKYQLSGQPTATTLVSAVVYDPFGPPVRITYGTGTTARALSRAYDQDYVVKSVVDASAVGDGLNLTFGRDAVSNLTSVKPSSTTGNVLLYDGLNRLKQVNDLSSNPQWTYTYDGTGNRISERQGTQAIVNYTYDPKASHHLWDVGATPRQYDLAGNTVLIGSGTTALGFHFNDTDRMDQALVGGAQVKQYLTNALGQRVSKSKTGDATKTVKTIYDESGHRLGDFNASNATIDQYLWMDDLPVGVVDGASNTVKYIEPDHLGTPRVVIDPAVNHAIWQWPILNDPFGKTQPVNVNSSTFALNLRFPGELYDAESGLNYNLYRDYDPGTGRYIESDPMGLKGGDSATYAYVKDTPLMLIDPTGLSSIFTTPPSCQTKQIGKAARGKAIDYVCKKYNKDDPCTACDCIYDAKAALCGPGNLPCIEKLKLKAVNCKVDCANTGRATEE